MEGNKVRKCGSRIAPLLVVTALFVQPVSADPGWPDTPVLDNATPVPEQELGEMRGRFMQGGQIVRFGISMVSRMQTATGEILEGNMDLEFDMSGSKPKVNMRTDMSIEDESESQETTIERTSGSRSEGSQTNGKGVVQQVQVAGNGNSAVNDMKIDVAEDAGAARSRARSGVPNTRMVGPGGSSVEISTSRKGVQLSLDVPGTGRVTQEIASGRGLRQAIRLNGDHNQAASGARLRVEMRDRLQGSSAASVGRAIESLKTLR